jgi:hypothetical protein
MIKNPARQPIIEPIENKLDTVSESVKIMLLLNELNNKIDKLTERFDKYDADNKIMDYRFKYLLSLINE